MDKWIHTFENKDNGEWFALLMRNKTENWDQWTDAKQLGVRLVVTGATEQAAIDRIFELIKV